MTVRIDKDDNIWAIDKGSDMIIKFNPEGRVVMVFGRKKEASDEAEPWTQVDSAPARRGRAVSPAHRRHLGSRRVTSSSATDTSIRVWRSLTRMATG